MHKQLKKEGDKQAVAHLEEQRHKKGHEEKKGYETVVGNFLENLDIDRSSADRTCFT